MTVVSVLTVCAMSRLVFVLIAGECAFEIVTGAILPMHLLHVRFIVSALMVGLATLRYAGHIASLFHL